MNAKQNQPNEAWNKGQKLPPEPLTDAECQALIKACSRRAPTGIRNAALIAVLWRGGLRISEALELKPKDLDAKQGTLRVLHGKGDKYRLVGLDPDAMAILQRWLDKRKSLGITGHKRIFCTLDGGPLSDRYARAMVKRMAKRAGVEKRVHPHGLRHTHAFELANEGFPVHEIQQQLGHSSVATTNTYISHLAPAERVARMQQRRMGGK